MSILEFAESHPVVTISATAIGLLLLNAMRALIGLVTRNFFLILEKTVLCRYNLEDSDTSSLLMAYFKEKAEVYEVGSTKYGVESGNIPRLKMNRFIVSLISDESCLLVRYKGTPLLVWPNTGDDGDGGSRYNPPSVLAIRGSINWKEFLLDVAEWGNAHFLDRMKAVKVPFGVSKYFGTNGRTPSYPDDDGLSNRKSRSSDNEFFDHWSTAGRRQVLNWGPEDFKFHVEKDALEDLAMSAEMEKVVSAVHFWFKNQAWYKERNLAWRAGFGLFGAPGVGKTSLIRCLAKELNVHIHSFDLASMNNMEFQEAWKKANKYGGPRFFLLEDFDSVFHGRTNVTQSHLTFDTVLNAIDGVERPDGLVLWLTSNHMELIDPALGVVDKNGDSTRPGRIDMAVVLPPLNEQGRYKIALRIMKDPKEAERLVKKYPNDTGAQFEGHCVSEARAMIWDEGNFK